MVTNLLYQTYCWLYVKQIFSAALRFRVFVTMYNSSNLDLIEKALKRSERILAWTNIAYFTCIGILLINLVTVWIQGEKSSDKERSVMFNIVAEVVIAVVLGVFILVVFSVSIRMMNKSICQQHVFSINRTIVTV